MKKNLIFILNLLFIILSSVLIIVGAFLGNITLIIISLFLYGTRILFAFVDDLNNLGENE